MPYTMGLIESIPTVEKRGGRLSAISGVVPSPFHLPPHCRFEPRCPYRWETCRTVTPELYDAGGRLARCHLHLAEATARVVAESAPGAARPGKHAFATYELGGPEALSQDDMARILGEVLGRPVTARAVPLEEMRAKARTAGLGEDRIEQMTVMNRHYDAHGMRGNPNVLRMLLGREPTTFRQYVERLARTLSSR
jgi:oligopeptide/dipeptide ABC transporter ATP-binding protein